MIAAGDAAHLESSGAFSTETATLAVANSRGMWNAHSVTQAKLLTVMTGEGGASGYAQAFAPDVRAIDPSAVGEEAADKATRSSGAVDLEPGEYPVILEEYAVATILEYLSWMGFSALAVEEGRSFMEIGNQIMGPNVTIWDDGLDPQGLPTAIDYEGVPKRRVDLISDGVARAVVHDTATARRAGTASTGHGLPAPNAFGPMAWNLFMAPGSSAKEVMMSGIRRGDLGHPLPLRQHHPLAARRPDRHDQGRHLPDRGWADHPADPQPALHPVDPRGLQRDRGDRLRDAAGGGRVLRHQRPGAGAADRQVRIHRSDRRRGRRVARGGG